jgi:hypothetical protein
MISAVLLFVMWSATFAHDVVFQHAEVLVRVLDDFAIVSNAIDELIPKDGRLAIGYLFILPWQIDLERNRTLPVTMVTDVSMSESLHTLCWTVASRSLGLFSPLSFQCNSLKHALLDACLQWIRADDADERVARARLMSAAGELQRALVEFLNLYRWPHACRAGPYRIRPDTSVQPLAWSAFDRLMNGESDCMALHSTVGAGNASVALDAPYIVILHRGDNNCAPSAIASNMLRRSVARRFPTVHFFELYSRSTYWSLVSSLSIKVAMSPHDSDVVRVLRQFTTTPAIVLLQCRRSKPTAPMQARFVATFGRGATSFLVTQFLAWRTGLVPLLDADVATAADPRAVRPLTESDFQQHGILPSEEIAFVLAATFLFARAAWQFWHQSD